MTKKAYIHAFKTIECLLGKQKEFTIKDLAVQFGCMEASDLAQQIHQRCIIIPSPLHPIISLYTPYCFFYISYGTFKYYFSYNREPLESMIISVILMT